MSKLQKFSMVGAGILLAFCAIPRANAQDRDRDRDWDREHERFTRIASGMSVPVRLTESIDTDRRDDRRIYHAVVAEDIRGENGRVAIPRGAEAELMVRVARDNDLVLDLEAINVNGQRYGIRSDPNRVESSRDNSLVGSIVGAISGGQVRGRAVRIQRDTILNFRLERPLEIGVSPRRWDRDH